MRRMITTKQAETLDNVVYNPQTNTTEVNGDLKVNGEIISGLPIDISVFGDPGVSPYSKEQLIDICLQYKNNDFAVFGQLGKLVFLDPNAQYYDDCVDCSKIFIIEGIIHSYYDDSQALFLIGEAPSYAWTLVAYYSAENEITISFSEL